jgi:hypothetical protein
MKESDLDYSFEAFIINHVPSWGIRFKFPDEEIVFPIGLELDTDIAIIHGVNPDPPRNKKGEHAVSAKKVRINEGEY